jgi:hypothetical protein
VLLPRGSINGSGTPGTHASSAITQLVTYTLTCDGSDADVLQNDLTTTVTIYRVPSWHEL